MATRVFRPARILPEPMQVKLPQLSERVREPRVVEATPGVVGEASPQAAGAHEPSSTAGIAVSAREAELQAENEQLKQTLREREEQHNGELQETHTRVLEGLQKVEETVANLTTLIGEFEMQRGQALQQIEAQLVPLATAIARRILGDSIAVREEFVLETVRRALSLVRERERVVIRVHPADFDLVRRHAEEWLQQLERSKSMDFEKDVRIRRGGCQIETESGSIEAQIDKQLAALEEALIEGSQ